MNARGAVALVLAAALVAGACASSARTTPELDVASNAIIRTIRLKPTPLAMALTEGAQWVTDRTVSALARLRL